MRAISVTTYLCVAFPKAFKGPRNLFWRWGGNSYAVRSGDWKLLHNGTISNRRPTEGIVNRKSLVNGTRLFNLREDISESRDLAEQHPEVVQRLKKLYADWSKEVAGETQELWQTNIEGTP